jgi:hypothetical protein
MVENTVNLKLIQHFCQINFIQFKQLTFQVRASIKNESCQIFVVQNAYDTTSFLHYDEDMLKLFFLFKSFKMLQYGKNRQHQLYNEHLR